MTIHGYPPSYTSTERTINTMDINKTILVDIDGTLLDGSHDNWFTSMVEKIGKERAVATYRKVTDKDDLKINMDLLGQLKKLKKAGCALVLCTNRGEAQRAMTEANLGEHMHLFSDSIYGAGKKTELVKHNTYTVIDNEKQNLVGARNILVKF